VCEAIHLEDALSNIWSAHKVDLEKLSLQVSLVWTVLNKSLKQECSGLLYSSIFKEYLNNTVNGSLGDICTVSVSDHFGERYSCLRVSWNDIAENLDKIWRVVHLLAVRHNLVMLSSLNKSLDDTLWSVSRVRSHVNRECKLRVELLDHVSELICEGKLVVLDPLL